MRRWAWCLAVGVAGLLCVSGAAAAQSEVDILLDTLVDKGILTHVEAGLIRREISETSSARNAQVAKDVVPAWSRNWKWKGDIRLRNEYRDRSASTNVNRQRVRFRVGFDAKVADTLKATGQIATGSTSDPVSTNDSFDDSFNKKPFNLDLAYLTYTPEIMGIDETKMTGGIMPNPHVTHSPLVWDGDLNFDGVAAKITKEFGDSAVFAMAQLSSLDTDIHESSQMWSMQVGASGKLLAGSDEDILDHLKLEGAVSWINYGDVRAGGGENGAIGAAGGLKGNLLASVHDWNLINPTGAISTKVNGIPVKLYADWVHNTASTEYDNGYLFGAKVGKAKKPWDLKEGWEAGYFFERIDPNATFGAFTDSDFGGGGTNHKGHVYYVTLATLKNSTLTLKYLDTQQVTGSKSHFDTLQADWVTKF
ncbi:MAG TPA: putative porin [bacterium]